MAVAKANKIKYPYPKVSQDVIDNILRDIDEGSTNKHAALANGISESHFYNLLRQGVCDLDHEKYETLEAKMVASLARIVQNEIKQCRESISFSPKGHAGAQWTLEHVYWRHFGNSAAAMELAKDIARLRGELGENEDE